MATFISSGVSNVLYKGRIITNNPINIDLVKEVRMVRYSEYPDNKGIPALELRGVGVTWLFPSEKLRNIMFNKIVNNEFKDKA